MDVWETQGRRKVRKTRVTNISNRARVEGGGHTINGIDFRELIQGRTILAGDFNARSPVRNARMEGRYDAASPKGSSKTMR